MAVAYKCGIVRIGAITLSTLFPIMLWALRRRPYRSRNTDNFLNLAVFTIPPTTRVSISTREKYSAIVTRHISLVSNEANLILRT